MIAVDVDFYSKLFLESAHLPVESPIMPKQSSPSTFYRLDIMVNHLMDNNFSQCFLCPVNIIGNPDAPFIFPVASLRVIVSSASAFTFENMAFTRWQDSIEIQFIILLEQEFDIFFRYLHCV